MSAQVKFNSHLNLNGNQLIEAGFQNLAVAPSSPFEGQIYYNTVEKGLFEYNGTQWVNLGNMSEEDIKALFSAGDGITYSSNSGQFSLNVDNTTIQVGASGLEVVSGSLGTSALADDSVTKEKINSDVAGEGLAQNADGSLEVDYDTVGTQLAGDGLVYDGVKNIINLVSTVHKENIGDGVLTTFTINHNLKSQDVDIIVLDTADNYRRIVVDSTNTTIDTSIINVNTAPSASQYRVIAVKL